MHTIKKSNSIFIGILSIVMVSIAACSPARNVSVSTGLSQSIRFQTAGRIPVIEVILNGKPARFIIDTGASVSVLNEPDAGYYGFRVIDPFFLADIEVTGFADTSLMKQTANCTLEIGRLKITHLRFKSKNISHLTSLLYRNECVRVAGILGSDMFTQYRMQIDFMNKTITF